MTRFLAALVLLVSLPALLGMASDRRTDSGVVNVYSARHYDADDALFERFTEETGIRVNLIEGRSDELLARLRQEGRLSPADVFITVDAGRLYRAEEQGVFQSVESDVLVDRVPEPLRHPDGLWFGLTKRVRVIVASRERVPTDLELSYEDLTDPRWRGRVLIRSSSNIYNQSLVASMIESHGPSETEAWCRGLVANLARTPQGGDRDQIRAVAAGEGDVAVVNHYYYAQMMAGGEADRRAAESVRVIFPNQEGRGAHVNISGAGVVRSAPNRENAIRFLEYLVGSDAQETIAAGSHEYPVVDGVATTSILRTLDTFKSDQMNAAKLGKNNAEAVRIMDRAKWR